MIIILFELNFNCLFDPFLAWMIDQIIVANRDDISPIVGEETLMIG